MKLYLIRHGQSEANVKNYFAGQSQVMLTEAGIKQAKNAGKLISHIKFDKVYSSDLYRAMDTQKLAYPDCECERTSLIREIDVGCLAGISLEDCRKRYGEELMVNRQNFNFAPYGGENSEMLQNRIAEFLKMATDSGYESIAAFCHGGLITATMEYLLGIKTDKHFFATDNCSINILEYKDEKWKLVLYNYTGEI